MDKKLLFPLSILSFALVCGGISSQTFANSSLKDDDVLEVAKAGEGCFYSGDYSTDYTDEPNYTTQADLTFSKMNYRTVHKRHRGDAVKVAVLDSGINYTHEDFRDINYNDVIQNNSCSIEWDAQNNQWLRYLYSNNTSHINDTLGHGTNVASVIASQINELGCAGIAPNIELYVYKVTNSSHGYEWGAIQTALTDCVTRGIDVINMSFQAYENDVTYNGSTMKSSSGCSNMLTTWLNNCYNHGITLVAAAGNYNTTERSYPASNNHVISVGSLAKGSTTTKAGYSNLSDIDLVAPGSVYVADKGSNSAYKKTQGTSFSSPIVTAAIALYIEQHPSATPLEIENALYASCDPIEGTPSWAGHGRLNVVKFLGDDVPSAVTVSNIDNYELNMEVGASFTLDVDVTCTEDCDDDSVSYEFEYDEGIASIDSNGVITASAPGEDIVTVRSNSNSDAYYSFLLTVTGEVEKTLSLSPSSTSIEEGFTEQLIASTFPEDIIVFSSNNTNVATVTSGGLVTAVSPGTARITASANGLNQHCDVTVTKSPLTSISIEGMTTKYALDSSFSFDGTCTAHYHNQTSKTVTPTSVTSPDMSSEGEKTITVSYTDSGVTKTVDYTITVSERISTGDINFTLSNTVATDANDHIWTATNCSTVGSYLAMKYTTSKIQSDYFYIDVNSDVDVTVRIGSFGGSQAGVNVYAVNSSGIKITNTVSATPTTNSNRPYSGTLEFSNKSDNYVSFVMETSNVTNNTKYIRCYYLNFTYTPGVEPPKVTNIVLDKSELNFDLYGTKVGYITPTVTYEEGADSTVYYTLSSVGIVSLSKNSGATGEQITVTALSVGSVTITATSGERSAICSVTVVDTTPIPVTTLNISNSEASLVKNAHITLTATALPNNATNKELLWSTDNSSIATISATSGNSITVTAVGEIGDSTTITVSTTDGSNLSKTCSVTIIEQVVQIGVEISGHNASVPYMNTYSVGSNVVVKQVMSDGNKNVVTPTSTNYTVDTTSIGIKQISATYGGFTGYANVKVTNNGASANVGEDSEEAVSQKTSFTTSSWGDANSRWTSGKNANGFNATQGVQISKGASGANATSKSSYSKISSIVVGYSTNGSSGKGAIKVKVGTGTEQSYSVTAPSSGGTAYKSKEFTFSPEETGTVKLTVNCDTNSMYIKDITINYIIGVSFPASPEEQAISWAKYFNSFTEEYCDVSGVNSDVESISSGWEEMANEYDYMTSEAKIALLDSSDTNIEKALTTYRVIVSKYGSATINNFIVDSNDNPIELASNYGFEVLTNTDNLLVVAITILSISSILGFFIYYKKKQNNY